uniref:Uncharacterized protein n=1 Tax=Arundo donax TaxID=35708 RepID=A0A0A9GNL9_ARUDO
MLSYQLPAVRSVTARSDCSSALLPRRPPGALPILPRTSRIHPLCAPLLFVQPRRSQRQCPPRHARCLLAMAQLPPWLARLLLQEASSSR